MNAGLAPPPAPRPHYFHSRLSSALSTSSLPDRLELISHPLQTAYTPHLGPLQASQPFKLQVIIYQVFPNGP